MKLLWTVIVGIPLLCACASSTPDHFYVLTALPAGASAPRSATAVQAFLRVSVPASADRPEMVLNTSAAGIEILEHERWAAPLADLAAQALARDIERRRTDLIVAAHGVDRPNDSAVKISVDLVQITARKGERASIEAHWRIADARAGRDSVGSEEFSAAMSGDSSAAVVQSLSECLGLLADRLAAQIPTHP